MNSRKHILEDLIQSFDTMRKHMLFRDAGAKSRIGPAQWIVMRIIAQKPDCTIKDIAEKMQVTSSAATQIVEKLVQNGYVIRKKSTNDRRMVILTLVDKASAEVAGLKKQALDRMSSVFDVLNDKELQGYLTLNKKISDQFQK